MGRPRNPWQRKTDDNHQEIMDRFRGYGFSVFDTSRLPKFVDCIIARYDLNALVEIKDGEKPPSARKLTPDEEDFHDNWKGLIYIVETFEDVDRIHKAWLDLATKSFIRSRG